ncbi:YihY/virulence factor BrkB family protein [Candidatus Ruminimicrobium bovinum]|uniref:YihY/virulence factor BrkB family protein n=1 Tax=Candidatus Ruminimicrobium bovinum TaxID=3242779 RepID=UPI0039B87A17
MFKNIYKSVKFFIVELTKVVMKQDVFGSAAEMSYMLTLSVFPLLLSFMAIFSILGKSIVVNEALNTLSQFAPDEVMAVIQTVLKEVTLLKGYSLVAIIGFLTTLYLASNSISVIIKCLNKSDKIKETRSFIHTKILSIVMVFIYMFFLFFSVNLIVFGQSILNLTTKYIHIIPIEISQLILFLRWPVTFVLIFVLAAINYYILPAKKIKIKDVFPGSLFFTVSWLIISWLFSVYINNFGSYNKVYGSIAAFAILMIWLYFTSIIILVGGEINNFAVSDNKKVDI